MFRSVANLSYYVLILIFIQTLAFSQENEKHNRLLIMSSEKQAEFEIMQEKVKKYAERTGTPIRQEFDDGAVIYLHHIENGKPFFYSTMNLGAAQTTRADKMWLLGITGGGYNKIGIWDSGKVRDTHDEFGGGGRITQVDLSATISNHATRVAGTLIAAGVVPDAKGMAFQSNLDAFDITNDETEMVNAAAAGMEVSNHSYGQTSGWQNYDHGTGLAMHWFGNLGVSSTEDVFFGLYWTGAADWDEIAFNAPNYLIVKAAGNDRDDTYSGDHYHWDGSILPAGGWSWANDVHDDDGGTLGYDCIITVSTAKNIMTVGAVNELTNYTIPGSVIMNNFSGWGPTDDGRIKPDLVAKGVGIHTCTGSSNTAYAASATGTSFSTANATGTLALLQQYYQDLYASIMRSATLKALAIHSANDAGATAGPDYQFGWGLLNAEYGAQIIIDDATDNTINELTLSNNGTYIRGFTSDGSTPIKVTIAWTDPKGTPVTSDFLNNREPMLVNDLDLRIIEDATSNSFYPWKLDPDIPSNAATNTGKNSVDNVEQVFIESPSAGNYTVEVTHDGILLGGSQDFSLIMTSNFQVLSVELSLFTAAVTLSGVQLDWRTESEIENLGFILERKTESTSWTELTSYKDNATLNGQGTVSHATDYSFTDTQVEAGVTYEYRLADVDYNGVVTYHATRTATVEQVPLAKVEEFTVLPAYPNPFNPSTTIRYFIPLTPPSKGDGATGGLSIQVYDLTGKLIATLFNGEQSSGWHSIVWNGTNTHGEQVPAGMYLSRIIAGNEVKTNKLMLLR